MIVSWMGYSIALGAFIVVAAHALDRAARANRLPARFIWLGALVATAFVPFAAYAIRRDVPVASPNGVTMGTITGLPASGPSDAPTLAAQLFDRATAVAATLDRPVVIAWIALSLILLGRIAFAMFTLWRRRHTWTPTEIGGVPLYVTPDLGPAVVALPTSRILVPEWLLSLEDAQIATVLHHEREHHAAGDARLLVAASVFRALLPWNPAVWWQTRRLRLAIEMDCDARVLRQDPRVDHYGALLLAIAQHPRTALYAAATLTESTSDLERRIDAMTSTPSSAPRLAAALCAVAATAAIVFACAMPAPDVIAGPSATAQSADVSPAKANPGEPYFDFQVEKPAAIAPGQLPPRYPDQLRAAGISGVVVVKFVVDTNGSAEARTLELIKSDHDLFTESVRQAVPLLRFTAAQVGGRPVKQLVQMPFVFSLSERTKVPMNGTIVPMSKAVQRDSPLLKSVDSHARMTLVIPADKTQPAFATPTGRDYIELPLRMKQVSAPSNAGDTTVAVPSQDNLPPVYPNQLRVANIEGQVIARFTVRADGIPDMDTFEIKKSDHDLFSNSVRNAVKLFRFKPATIDGKPVDSQLEMPFVFSLSK